MSVELSEGSTPVAELCGAPAEHGPCALPKAHNMGNLDIPSNHQASPTDDEINVQADLIYDYIHTKIFRVQWRSMYQKMVRDGEFPTLTPPPPETEEQKKWREFRESQQRAADMRRERAQRQLERDAESHRAHLRSQGWDM